MPSQPKKEAQLELGFEGPYRRAFFNTFELDRSSTPGFVISHFALVVARESLDRLTVVIPQRLIDAVTGKVDFGTL
ncbi:MAG TPA: hypothetical protein VE860_09315 [Chthoniobacterales bacterium]|jgi:hypothetical protein|nr:hypothetical protein [Chthoniobacterales bacterium]